MQDRPPRQLAILTPSKWWVTALLIGLLFYAFALPIVFSSSAIEGRAAADHLNYHEPVIHTFADDWPRPDLSNYHSATTPLYHLILAGVEVALSPTRRGMMLVASVWTLALFTLLASTIRLSPKQAIPLLLPVVASMYVLFPGIWLLPDNAGWLGVFAILVLSLRQRVSWRTLAWSGVLLVQLVLIRQIHLWAAGVIWAAAWLGSQPTPPGHNARNIESHHDTIDAVAMIRSLLTISRGRMVRLGLALACTLPAFVAVVYFVNLWDGFVVPRYQEGHHGGYHGWNPATPAFHLAIVGSFAPFFAGYLLPGFRRLCRNPGVLIGAIVLALMLVVIPETTYATDLGRKSGLWNLVKAAPVIAGHTSVVLIVLAPIGVITIASLLAAIDRRSAWIYLGAFVAFNAAQTASPQLWQRYHEPFILIMLALMAAAVVRARRGADEASPVRLWQLLGPALLGCALGALSIWTVLNDSPAVPLETGDFERSVDYEPLI